MTVHWHDDEREWCPCDEPADAVPLAEARDDALVRRVLVRAGVENEAMYFQSSI